MKTDIKRQAKIDHILSRITEPKQETYLDLLILSGWTDGQPVTAIFKGKAAKPLFWYRFKTEAEQVEYLAKELKAADERADKAKELEIQKETFAQTDFFKEGDIIVSSWGYDQTNIDFYKVIGFAGKTQLIVQEIGKDYEENGFMCGHSTPNPNAGPNWRKDNKPFKITLRPELKTGYWKEGYSICSPSYKCYNKWEGKPMYESHYA